MLNAIWPGRKATTIFICPTLVLKEWSIFYLVMLLNMVPFNDIFEKYRSVVRLVRIAYKFLCLVTHRTTAYSYERKHIFLRFFAQYMPYLYCNVYSDHYWKIGLLFSTKFVWTSRICPQGTLTYYTLLEVAQSCVARTAFYITLLVLWRF